MNWTKLICRSVGFLDGRSSWSSTFLPESSWSSTFVADSSWSSTVVAESSWSSTIVAESSGSLTFLADVTSPIYGIQFRKLYLSKIRHSGSHSWCEFEILILTSQSQQELDIIVMASIMNRRSFQREYEDYSFKILHGYDMLLQVRNNGFQVLLTLCVCDNRIVYWKLIEAWQTKAAFSIRTFKCIDRLSAIFA